MAENVLLRSVVEIIGPPVEPDEAEVPVFDEVDLPLLDELPHAVMARLAATIAVRTAAPLLELFTERNSL
ncbi:hypothetical protein [Rudaeicoccus suwonensis]|uniref:hypothetical protein n=1 Tax=Rudaeicoccus suwonensis TaxID=657409 RepID=UPI001476B957|nr:hypothetical protein [Rudaeicoccus suwonensis]